MLSIEFSNQSKKFLKNLDNHEAQRVIDRLELLKKNPVPSDAKFIGRENGEKLFRYRIGNCRALYKIKEIENIILITKIDKRPRVYDKI
jgi:mRNA-degrading endonuclease RelE of RelBE toxin-antitoxin system